MKKWFITFALLTSFPLGLELIKNSERYPAAVNTNSSCFELLSSFYNVERNKILEKRVEGAANDVHMFYRSFPPLYYKLAENCNWRDKFGPVSTFLSVMAGDAHIENFGLKFYNKKLRLSVNDYDDLTYGPPFLDVLRLITSAKLAGVDVDKELIKDFLESYKNGIKGKSADLSKATLKLFRTSEKNEMIDLKMIDISSKIFKKKKTPNSPLEQQELERWKNALSDEGEIKDSYLFIKQIGGSAGLKRYQFLIEKDGKLSWLEAKEWTEPSYNVATQTAPPTDLKRYNAIVTYDKPFVSPKLAKIDRKTFYLRNIDARQLGVDLADFDKKELRDVLIDEAYSLGNFHRTYMSHEKEYYKSIEDHVHKSDIIDFAEEISSDFKYESKKILR